MWILISWLHEKLADLNLHGYKILKVMCSVLVKLNTVSELCMISTSCRIAVL